MHLRDDHLKEIEQVKEETMKIAKEMSSDQEMIAAREKVARLQVRRGWVLSASSTPRLGRDVHILIIYFSQ